MPENPPAFPHAVEYVSGDCGAIIPHGGMTLRDYYAAKAMASIVAADTTQTKYRTDLVAQWAYELADAMLAAREAKP